VFWNPGNGERVATRGAEWFRFRDGLIAEIRSYYVQRDMTMELDGFQYADRGYSLAGSERSAIHEAGRRPCRTITGDRGR